MARIPEEVIERLKQGLSLERLVEAQGIKLKRHGADLTGLCPSHDDQEPASTRQQGRLAAVEYWTKPSGGSAIAFKDVFSYTRGGAAA